MQINIECSVLSTLFMCEEMYEEPFKVDPEVFTTSFNKRVAKLINETIDKCGSTMLLMDEIWEKCDTDRKKQNFLDIIWQTQLPISVAKKYYQKLKIMHIERMAKGALNGIK